MWLSQVLVLRMLERLARFPTTPPPPPDQLQTLLCPPQPPSTDGLCVMVRLLSCEDREVVQQVLGTLRQFLTALTPSDHGQDTMGPSMTSAALRPGADGLTPRRPSSASRAGGSSLTRALSSSVGRLGPWLSSLWAPSSSSRPQSWRGSEGGWGLDRGHSGNWLPHEPRGAAFVLSKVELEEAQQLLQDLERERSVSADSHTPQWHAV